MPAKRAQLFAACSVMALTLKSDRPPGPGCFAAIIACWQIGGLHSLRARRALHTGDKQMHLNHGTRFATALATVLAFTAFALAHGGVMAAQPTTQKQYRMVRS